MKIINHYCSLVLAASLFSVTTIGMAESIQQEAQDVELRKQWYRDAVAALGEDASIYEIPVFAKRGESIPEDLLAGALDSANSTSGSTPDFAIATLVRTLYLIRDTYPLETVRRIEENLASKKYWIDQPGPLMPNLVPEDANGFNDNSNMYFTENHFITWMSSDYLVRQHFGLDIPEDLKKRIKHFLFLRAEYGMTEFFSPVYYPITMGAFLNLVDFADDPDIRDMATIAAERLLMDNLSLVTDIGAFFPATARAKPGRYKVLQPRGTFWIAANKGSVINDGKRAECRLEDFGDTCRTYYYEGSFLSSSDISLGYVANKRSSNSFHGQWEQGYDIDDRKDVHEDFSKDERTFFQISGGYLIGDGALADTVHAAKRWDIIGDIGDLLEPIDEILDVVGLSVNGIIKEGGSAADKVIAPIARSLARPDVDLEIFKNRNVALMSAQDYFEGKLGSQQFPWVATVEDIAVWTQSGVDDDWSMAHTMLGLTLGNDVQNAHLPMVSQRKNVALISYNPLNIIWNFLWQNREVALYWPEDRFDFSETVYPDDCGGDGWLLGKKNDSYIAIKRGGDDERSDGTSIQDNKRQYWGVVVGNKDTHGDYHDFRKVIKKSHCHSSYKASKWYKPWDKRYKIHFEVDGQDIRDSWDYTPL